MREPTARLALAAAALVASGATALGQSDPLARLAPKPGDSVCFSRDYDAVHLKAHPTQLTTSVVLSYRNEEETNVRIMIRQKNRPAPLYMVATCSWNGSVNRDVNNKPILKGVRSKAGFDCIPRTDKDSEEGGFLVVEPDADGRSLLLHLDENESAWSDTDLSREPQDATFGGEDRLFRLARTGAEACRPMEKELIVKWLR